MDQATNPRPARRGWVSEDDDDIEYTVSVTSSRAELCQQWGDEDNGAINIFVMSITDLKRLIQAAQSLLKMTGNDTPLPPPGGPETDNI